MTLHSYDDLVQGSEEWLAQRRGMVTASVVGNLIATRKLSAADFDCPSCDAPAGDPCRSLVKAGAVIKTMHPERAETARDSSDVVLETADGDNARSLTTLLVSERINGWTEPTYVSDDMLRGIEDEPRARDLYAQHYAPVTETGLMVRDDWGFRLGYSPDGLVGDDGLIEVKSRKPKKQVDTVLAGQPPAENMAQLQTGLLVTGRAWLDYVSYSGGMHLFVHRVYPDPKWFDAIVAATANFERNAADMVRLYTERVTGMPLTERILEMEMTF